jgi:hypothetical protein
MRNSTCVICSKEFAPREGKLYCSNACKQKAYADKKNVAIVSDTDKEQEEKKKKQFTIYFPEYQEYSKKYPNNKLIEFPLFCFFRKNWIGEFDLIKFREYMKSYDSNFWEDFYDSWNEGKISPARKKYNQFQEQFFGGDDFIVAFGENGK